MWTQSSLMTTFVLFLSFFVCRQYPNGAAFENRFDLSTYNDEHLVRLTIYQSRHLVATPDSPHGIPIRKDISGRPYPCEYDWCTRARARPIDNIGLEITPHG